MRRQLIFVGLAVVVLVSMSARGQDAIQVEQPPQPQPAQPLPPPQGSAQQPPSTVRPPASPQPARPTTPPATDTRMMAGPTQPMDLSAQPAPLLRAEPRMIGDLPGYFATEFLTVRSLLSAGPFPNGVTITNSDGVVTAIVPPGGSVPNFAQINETYRFAALALSRGSFKIAENESVQPQDRVFVTYNYFHEIPNQLLAAGGFLTILPNPIIRVAPGPYVLQNTLASTLSPNTFAGQPTTLTNPILSSTNLHRETIGFEKTFFDGNASVGLRLPVFQSDQAASTPFDAGRLQSFAAFPISGNTVASDNTIDQSRVGDLSVLFKYAFINDPNGDRTASAGLVVTAPTGGGILLADGSKLYSTLLQPWLGLYRSWDRMFAHGFTSIAVPTDHRDLTYYFGDIGVGYFAYRNPDAWLSSITPTFECHADIPFQKTRDSGIMSSDVVVLTAGVHFGLGRHSTLTFAAATPITGPRPDQFEATVQLNWGF